MGANDPGTYFSDRALRGEAPSRLTCARGLLRHALDVIDGVDPHLTVPLSETIAAACRRLAEARVACQEGSPEQFDRARKVVEEIVARLVEAADLPGDRREFHVDAGPWRIWDYTPASRAPDHRG